MDVVQGLGGAASLAEVDVCVDFVIYLEIERGKEDKNTIVAAVISTTEEAVVGANAEERETQPRNVVDATYDDRFTPHFDGNDALSSNKGVAVVGKRDILVMHAMVRCGDLV